ncbi:isochorismatase family protein [Paenibacillus sp. GbtcB18]|uniref:isochorismatase family protein n=1 Tax=Paenibacillus sp. GbtcB18 TaxID=2824763 RepID=UPI001C2F539C|nr:isochorismatase family protein [Paenibacillus sp. GbtcB18]
MAIPSVQSYPMPTAEDLPANRVSWTPDPSRAAFLIHDMQQYFMACFEPGQSPAAELAEHIRLLADRCRELGVPVIYSAQPGAQTPEQRRLLQDFWGSGIGPDLREQQIIAELEPGDNDIRLTKWRYSAFQKTDLAEQLKAMGRDQLIIVGIYAHIGCLMTACEAFMRDIEAFMVSDALADFSREKHDLALKYAAERCAVTLTTGQLLAHWAKETSEAVNLGQAEAGAVSNAAADIAETAAADGRADGPEAAGAPDPYAFALSALRQQVAGLLRERPDAIGDEDNLPEYWGLDSIRIMTLAERWRSLGASVTFAELAEEPTLLAWSKLLASRTVTFVPNGDYYDTAARGER